MEIDLGFLFNDLDKTVNTVLTILPMAPLSMVDKMPGNLYKTLSEPSKYQLCGAFENALGFHFDENFRAHVSSKNDKKGNLRSQIKKRIDNEFSRQKKEKINWEFADSGFSPLLAHLFDVGLVVRPHIFHYLDLWKQARTRKDGTYSHPNGTMNLSHEIIHLKMDLPREQKGTLSNASTAKLFKEHMGKYPMYYSTVTRREFIAVVNGVFKMQLKMTTGLFVALSTALVDQNINYLGTNEGWVDLKIEKI